MNQQQEQATQYLAYVINGMTRRKVEILCESSDVGMAFTIVPTVPQDYRILIGSKGKNCSLLRQLMKLWRNENAPNMSIHVFVPNPKLIKE